MLLGGKRQDVDTVAQGHDGRGTTLFRTHRKWRQRPGGEERATQFLEDRDRCDHEPPGMAALLQDPNGEKRAPANAGDRDQSADDVQGGGAGGFR